MYLFLDNNVFRSLTHINQKGDVSTFLQEVQANSLAPSIDTPSFAMTPFSLLESIGVVPVTPTITLPDSLANAVGHEGEICDYILGRAFEFLEQCPELSHECLLNKAYEQRQYTKDNALDLFEKCVVNPLRQTEAYKHIIQCLAIDMLFKYPFLPTLAPHMHSLFLAMLFSQSEVDNAASLFRVMKRLWDNNYHEMHGDEVSFDHQYISTAFKQMRIKNDRDYLDCDLVHFLYVGYVSNGRRTPVAAFTTDPLDTIVTRIAVFKAVTEVFRNKVLAITGRQESEVVQHEPGILVHCSSEAHVEGIVQVNKDIPPFTGRYFTIHILPAERGQACQVSFTDEDRLGPIVTLLLPS